MTERNSYGDRMIAWLRKRSIQWPAVLLFTALLAQAPHASAVFMRIAPHGDGVEVATSFVGAWVYAIALEGATAYFVWRNKLNWAIAFAVFSVAHNVAYYMPVAWSFDVYGATLTVQYVMSAVLISISLPVAIAAFSHVQATQREAKRTVTKLVKDVTPAPVQVDDAPAQDVTPAPVNKSELARKHGVTRQTIDRWIKAGKIEVQPHLNGATGD